MTGPLGFRSEGLGTATAMIRRPRLDQSVPMLAQGYAWLPDRRRAAGRNTVHTRLMGTRRALGVAGPDGARFV